MPNHICVVVIICFNVFPNTVVFLCVLEDIESSFSKRERERNQKLN